MLNAMSPVPKPNFEFSPYNLHKTKWPPYAFSMVMKGKRYNSYLMKEYSEGLQTWWQGWSRDMPCVVNVKDQKVNGQGHKVMHNKFTQSRALALVTLESKRPLIVVVTK